MCAKFINYSKEQTAKPQDRKAQARAGAEVPGPARPRSRLGAARGPTSPWSVGMAICLGGLGLPAGGILGQDSFGPAFVCVRNPL